MRILSHALVATAIVCISSIADAQTTGRRPLGTPGNEWSGNGYKLITISGRTRVAGGKCIYEGHSKAAGYNYTTVERDEFEAQPQPGGYLCVNGSFHIKGQDGKKWTGPIHYKVLFRNGKGYQLD